MTKLEDKARSAALRNLMILDTPPEPMFDMATGILAKLFGVPHACISLVDEDRVWFKSAYGISATEVEKHPGFCVTLVANNQEVRYFEDASHEPSTKDHPLVTNDPRIRFYAGAPLTTTEGIRIGTLCTFGPQPRGISETEIEALRGMATMVMREIELRQARNQLHRTEVALRASQRLEGVGLVASGVAHDFNNLLAGILGNAELLGMETTHSARARRLIDEILATGRRASDLVSQVLAYAGSDEQFPPAPIDFNELILDTYQMIKGTVDKRARVDFDLSEDLPTVFGRSTAVRQVVMNLLTNACEACADTDGMVFITTHYDHESLGPTLTISDNGCGLSEAACARIFDPFYTSKTGGSGLGLAICARIVTNHGGTISASSKLNSGTTMRVVLPKSAHEAAESMPDSIETQPDSQPGMILVVDDEDSIRNFAYQYLTSEGHEVLAANGGEQAIEILLRNRQDVCAVLLDWSMPNVGGEKVIEAMQDNNLQIPVILSSGHVEQEARAQLSSRFPIDSFLKKPYSLTELKTCIDKALALKA